MKNVGTVQISKEFLGVRIPFPKGTKILGCMNSNPQDSSITFYVEGDEISPRKEGEICPEVRLEVTRHKDKSLTSKFVI